MKSFENNLKDKGYKVIVGVDEAGRGPLAGPVVAAAVILDMNKEYEYINDSKKLTEKKRNLAFQEVKEKAIAIGLGVVDNNEIDKINILNATKKAMKKAIDDLKINYDYVLIDAVKLDLDKPSDSIIKGDAKSISIAAASVIAKVTRDEIMYEYDEKYPQYGFKNHKGYPTKKHKELIEEYGICPIHRKTFSPINKKY